MTENLKRVGLHHSFDADLAVELKSVDLAILVHHFQYWIRHNAETGRNLHEGRTWFYQTIKDIVAHFPYWSEKQVRTIIDKLVEKGVLIKGNFNKSPYDQTKWYAFKDEEKFSISRNREISQGSQGICPNGQIGSPKSANQSAQTGRPIPNNITDNIQDNKTHPLPPKGESACADKGCSPSTQKISEEAKSLTDQFVEAIREVKPDYVPPKQKTSWHKSAEALIHQDKREPAKVMHVLKWALSDNAVVGDWNGWSHLIIGSKNPVQYLRSKFDGIEMKSKASKQRKFLPSSNDDLALQEWQAAKRRGQS